MTTSKKFKIKPSVFIAIGIAAALGGWLYSGPGLHAKSSVEPSQSASPTTQTEVKESHVSAAVRVVRSHAYDHQPQLKITAQSEYNRTTTLRSETFGTITKLNLEESYPVERGEHLVQLEIRDRKAQINRAKAILEQRQIEYEAANKLAQKGFNSRIRKSEALANLEAAKADLLTAEIELNNTAITSPFSGIILEKFVEIGDYVQTGDDIVKIVDLDPIYVIAYISEKNINDLELGNLATATFGNGAEYTGSISQISPVAQAETRSFEVKIEIPNEENKILSGLTAQVSLPTAPIRAHYLSPALLTLNDLGKIGIKITDQNQIVKFVPVTIVEDTNEGVWVSGLPDIVDIIAVGQEYVKDGSKVEISTFEDSKKANGS